MNTKEGWTKHKHDIVQLRVPVPFSLRWVNSYLLKDKAGYTMIDPGLHTEAAVLFWHRAKQELGFEWSSIKRIIITHQHPDHYGLAGYMQQLTKAPVYISSCANAYTEKLWGSQTSFHMEMRSLLFSHGVDESLIDGIIDNLAWFNQRVQPRPEVTYISPSDAVEIDGYNWRLIEVQGHANGQLMLYDEARLLMLCGDQVLPNITPHVGVVPGEIGEPLEQFLKSLASIKAIPVNMVYPGHREPFEHWEKRIEEIIEHHQRRLQSIVDYVSEQKQINAFQCCNWLFGNHLHEQPQQLRFAMTEVIAHLEYLVQHKKLKSINNNGQIAYQL